MLLLRKYITILVKMFKQLSIYYLNRTRRYFEENTLTRLGIVLIMLLTIFAISAISYYITKGGLETIQAQNNEFISKSAPLFVYQLFLLINGFLIFTSTVIFVLFNFFKSGNDSWIMASPRFKTISWFNFFKSLLTSSWSVIVIAIPLLLAIQTVFEFSFFFFLISFFIVICFSFFCCISAIILIFVLSLIMDFFSKKSFLLLSSLTALITLFLGFLIWHRVINIDIMYLFQVEEIVNPSLSIMINNFAIFPSHLPAMVIFHLQHDSFSFALPFILLMFSLTLFAVILFTVLNEYFLNIWQVFQEGSFEAKSRGGRFKKFFNVSFLPSSSKNILFYKEFLTGSRSLKNIFWFSFLLLLLFAQVGVIHLILRYSSISTDEVFFASVPAIQLVMILYFVCAFILRFVFPSFSEEGRTAWIIGSAPIDLMSVFWSKYRFYAFCGFLLSSFSLLLYIFPLGVDLIMSLKLFVFSFFSVLTLVMLGLSFGVFFANFNTDDPSLLSTSGPGIGFTLVSLSYSVLVSYLLFLSLSSSSFLPIIFFLFFSCLIFFVLNSLVLRFLSSFEFNF